MDSPLGREVGNACEVIESIETLKGSGPQELEQLSVLLAARMLVVAGVTSVESDAEARVRKAITSGAGVEKLRAIIEHQGGNPRVVDDYALLPSAPDRTTVAALRPGFVAAIEAERVGRAAVALGAGRGKLDDVIDHGVGITVLAPPGSEVRRGDAVLEVRHRAGKGLESALAMLEEAVQISDASPVVPGIVVDRV
jgi:pyrimidine-nucleoside phosphorylase